MPCLFSKVIVLEHLDAMHIFLLCIAVSTSEMSTSIFTWQQSALSPIMSMTMEWFLEYPVLDHIHFFVQFASKTAKGFSTLFFVKSKEFHYIQLCALRENDVKYTFLTFIYIYFDNFWKVILRIHLSSSTLPWRCTLTLVDIYICWIAEPSVTPQ